VSSPGDWFNGNAFAGHGSALGYSEVMLPLLVVFAPVFWVSGDPILAHNLTLLAEIALCLTTTYLLARRLGSHRWTATAAAIAFSFSSYTFTHVTHLQLMTIGFFPMGVLALLGMLRRQRVRDGIYLGVASFLIVTGCLYYAPVWVTAVALVVLIDLLARRGRVGRDWWASVVAGAASSAVFIAPIAILYLKFQQSVGFTRSVDAALGANPSDLLAPSPDSYAYRSLATAIGSRLMSHEHSFFPGVIMLSLGVVGLLFLVSALRRPGRLLTSDWMVLSVLAAVALLIAVGPELGGFPTPFRVLSRFVPGVDSIRAPARLVVVALLVIILAGAQVLDRLRTMLGLPAVISAAVALLVAVELAAPVVRAPIVDRTDVVAMQAALAAQPAGLVVELPAASLADGAPGVYLEAERMLRSIGYWRPRVNGTSGGDPPGFAEEVSLYNTFPQPAAVAAMRVAQIRYAVLHLGTGGPFLLPESVLAQVSVTPGVTVVGRYGDLVIVDVGA